MRSHIEQKTYEKIWSRNKNYNKYEINMNFQMLVNV